MKLPTTTTTTLLSLTSTLAAPSAPPTPVPETIHAAQPSEITYQPAADTPPPLHKRADHGVRLCTDADWGGYCVTPTTPHTASSSY